MQTGYRNLRRWPFATILSARKYGCDNIFAKRGAELGSKLCMAILRGDNMETDKLLDAGAPLDFRDEPDGWTPLIYGIYYRNQRACQWLLDHGADPEQSDFSGRTPLMVAAIVDDVPLVKRLLEMNVAPEKPDCHGQTAFDFARKFHNRECASLLWDALHRKGAVYER